MLCKKIGGEKFSSNLPSVLISINDFFTLHQKHEETQVAKSFNNHGLALQ